MTQRDWHDALSRVNLNQLLSFLVVAEERSFRMAALRMHISQSAVSRYSISSARWASRSFTELRAAWT